MMSMTSRREREEETVAARREPILGAVAAPRTLGVCARCALDRDAALDAGLRALDSQGRWRGGMYAGLLASCARACHDLWPVAALAAWRGEGPPDERVEGRGHMSTDTPATAAASPSTPARFNPSEHLSELRGKKYLEVKWRLAWLRSEHPEAEIVTELVAHDRERQWAMFRATVRYPHFATDQRGNILDDRGAPVMTWASATGYGQEDAAGFRNNPGDYLEKAETKALGRALAALGYGTQFCDDYAEAPGEVVDSPVQHTPAQTRSAGQQTAPVARTARGSAPARGEAPRPAQRVSDTLTTPSANSLPPGAVITGEAVDGKRIYAVSGVTFTLLDTPKGLRYQTTDVCSSHPDDRGRGHHWVARLEEGTLTSWSYRLPGGTVCTMPPPTGR